MNVLTNQLPSLFGEPTIANMTVNGTDFVHSFLNTASRASPLMQGFMFLYQLLEQRFGLDPSLVLTVLGLGWGLMKMISQLQMLIMVFVDTYLMSSISVTENDVIYNHLMRWMSLHPALKSDRYLMAQTEWNRAWENDDDDDLISTLSYTDGGDSEGQHRYLNFSNQAARSVSMSP